MIKANISGSMFLARFSKDGNVEEFQITENEYDRGPSKDGYVFLDAKKVPRYDTSDGLLHDGQYADIDEYTYLVKLEGCAESPVSRGCVVNGELDQQVEGAIRECKGNIIKIWP